MMFNVPIPGGSTGHAVGGAIIGIIMGPWAAVVSISVALIIQALVFGDGGITAIGANCFNMAVVIPFVGYYLYKIISGNSDIKSARRIVAAVIAGYISLSVAAGCAGFEFGIQPYIYPAVNGQYPYMPYDLSVTLPAMLGEHMLFFSILEAIITGLVFIYFQRNEPGLLEEKKLSQKMPGKISA
jgi:cobalt/nickel transport system permease protein